MRIVHALQTDKGQPLAGTTMPVRLLDGLKDHIAAGTLLIVTRDMAGLVAVEASSLGIAHALQRLRRLRGEKPTVAGYGIMYAREAPVQ